LHSLTVKAVSQTSNGGPLALQNLSGDQPFDLWVGGLVADQAKLLDTLESVFHVPAAMLTEPSQRAYEEGVAFSKAMEFRLRRAISAHHKELGDDLDRAEVRDRRRQVQDKAMTQYWTDAERYVNKLLAVAENPAMLGLDGAWQKTDWGRGIWRAALAAYDDACSHETARQIRAYALGRQALVAVPAAQQPRKETGS
jgi:CRISPR system Cascade subunit CasA